MAVEAAGTGVLPLETDERLSVADDMDMVDMGLKGCGEKNVSIPTVWEPLKNPLNVCQGQMQARFWA